MLTAQLYNFYRNSSTNYYGSSSSWQHLWSNETLFFLYHNWRMNERMKMNNRLGFSYEVYRLHGNDKVTHFSPRYNMYLSYRISKKQQLFADFALGNSYPEISSLNSAEQVVDMLHVKRGNPYLDNAIMYGYSVKYNLSLRRFGFLFGLYSENAHSSTLPMYNAEGDKVVEAYYSDGNSHFFQLYTDLSYRPVDVLKIRLVGRYEKYKITGLRNLNCDNLHLRMYLTYYLKDFALNLYYRTKRKDLNEQCAVGYNDPAYYASISWSHGNWYAELYANNFLTQSYESRTELSSDVYCKTSYRYNRPMQRSAFIKLAYTFNFGKKTKRDEKDIDTNVNSAILKAE